MRTLMHGATALKAERARKKRVADYRKRQETRRANARESGIRSHTTHSVRAREANVHAWLEGSRACAMCVCVPMGAARVHEIQVDVSLDQNWEGVPVTELKQAMTLAVNRAMMPADEAGQARVSEIVERALTEKGL